MNLRATFPLAVLALGSMTLAAALPARAQQDKLAQTTMKFLALSVDARASALGDAVTAVEGLPTSLFYNPAGMARQTESAMVGVGQVQWIADVNHNIASASFAPARGRFGIIGVTLQQVDYGDLQETIRANNDQGYDDLGAFSPSAFAVGVGYARALTDRFSIGAHVKYASLDLASPVEDRGPDGALVRGDAQESTFAFDFGMLYKTGFRSLNFAVAARNFSPEVTFVRESAQLPLTLRIGVAMNVADLTSLNPNLHALNVSVDANNSRDFQEQMKVGAEYGFMNTLFLRGGYSFPTDEQGVSLGAGVQRKVRDVGFGADYAYTDFGMFNTFGRVHRLALRFSF